MAEQAGVGYRVWLGLGVTTVPALALCGISFAFLGAIAGIVISVFALAALAGGAVLVHAALSQQMRAAADHEATIQSLHAAIEQRERAENIVRHVQKMDVLGQLTGGIAHDFNNMLAVIVANLETLQLRLTTDDPKLRDPIALALQGAERSALLTHRLLAFARRQPLEPRPADINKLVSGMANFVRRTLGEHIETEIKLGAEIWSVRCDINQMENALLNLAVNARDAMPDGGKLTIETANLCLKDSMAATDAELGPGQYVTLTVTDTGFGMAQDVMEKACEPFFTTKEQSHGKGLGLSQVYGFVKQSNGHMGITSEPGKGTVIVLYLPRLLDMHAVDEEDESPNQSMPRARREGILIVEDNEFLATTVQDILRDQGYRTFVASDGTVAMQILQSTPDIQLLFTDVGLPGALSGHQLAEEALRHWPGLKVLFTTGYIQDTNADRRNFDPGVAVIAKPFTYAALIDRIDRALQ